MHKLTGSQRILFSGENLTALVTPSLASASACFGRRNSGNIWTRRPNRYADQQCPPANWSPVTVQGMRAFIGLTLGMGILKLPVRSDYWRTTKRIFLTQFRSVMSRDRYLLIWRYLHLANNNLQDRSPNKLAKLRPMLTPVLVPSPSTQMGKDMLQMYCKMCNYAIPKL
ncbi:PiggyBac transposable element-derived protein 4 [Elysia marginata]|uniref:PiggyBac transposable element-derived protein 4 n=1 Tax=Elysia marginata TaxID=1093978 RepID=A0AAV4ID33_9GAST|nr:PiggyBac transposable element-derived protein 4 [Elysia marginata]